MEEPADVAPSVRRARPPFFLQLDTHPTLPTLRNTRGGHFARTIHNLRIVRTMNMLVPPTPLPHEALAADPPPWPGRIAGPAALLPAASRPGLRRGASTQPAGRIDACLCLTTIARAACWRIWSSGKTRCCCNWISSTHGSRACWTSVCRRENPNCRRPICETIRLSDSVVRLIIGHPAFQNSAKVRVRWQSGSA